MNHRTISPALLERLKREAKALKKSQGISHSAALEQLAEREGFNSYWDLLRAVSEAQPVWPDSMSVHFALDRKDAHGRDPTELALLGIEEDVAFEEFLWETTSEERFEEGLEDCQVFRFSGVSADDLPTVVHKVMDHFFFPPEAVWIGGREVKLTGLRTERIVIGDSFASWGDADD